MGFNILYKVRFSKIWKSHFKKSYRKRGYWVAYKYYDLEKAHAIYFKLGPMKVTIETERVDNG
jgi:hypothetical protein